ncbi:hypothetical protein HPP92_024141 [Vanilla planifolia]|uniref:CCT domain-containing protein n=1 Tax=Vanilla planifolia TaxID=51239 RepID=A0A835UCN6_VANPL|nr:hypothetical protein HPP92_024474 [Vanilla planifolia]KAG0456353.1 hypothetical protein HPP92_024141 [Vanilla planifolia]
MEHPTVPNRAAHPQKLNLRRRPPSSMASSSGTNKTTEPSGQTAAALPSHSSVTRECESCRNAPGIPFCRVEWSFLCPGCASVVHANSWVVSVTPNSNPNANLPHFPYCPFPYPYPFANPNSDPNAVVHLSSEDDDLSPADLGAASGARGRRMAPGVAASYRRLECVMRYREKRKSRRFEKTVRYENRRAYAELRPRVDGKFARRESGEEVGPLDVLGVDPGSEVGENVKGEEIAAGYMGMDGISQLKPDSGGGLAEMVAGDEVLGQPDFIEDVRFP